MNYINDKVQKGKGYMLLLLVQADCLCPFEPSRKATEMLTSVNGS